MGLPNATVNFNSGGWGGLTNSTGNYSGSLIIPSNQSVTVVITPPSPRQLVLTTNSGTLVIGATTTVPFKTVGAASGYHCTNLCPEPFHDTWHVTQSLDAVTLTMVYNSLSNRWIATTTDRGYYTILLANGGFGHATTPTGTVVPFVTLTSLTCATAATWTASSGSGHLAWPDGTTWTTSDL